MHPAGRFLGQDPEQQRLRQPGALEIRPHQVAHVLVVLMADDQRVAHVGQPAADALLHCRVELHHLHEPLPIAEQRRRPRGLGHIGRHAFGQHAVRIRIERVDIRVRTRRGLIGPGLEQALEGGDKASRIAAAQLAAFHHHVLHVLQRGVTGSHRVRLAVACPYQGLAIAGFSLFHALLQRLGGLAVTPRLGIGILGKQQRQAEDGNGRQAGGGSDRQWHGKVGSKRTRRLAVAAAHPQTPLPAVWVESRR